jgi:hypothetical protein
MKLCRFTAATNSDTRIGLIASAQQSSISGCVYDVDRIVAALDAGAAAGREAIERG